MESLNGERSAKEKEGGKRGQVLLEKYKRIAGNTTGKDRSNNFPSTAYKRIVFFQI